MYGYSNIHVLKGDTWQEVEIGPVPFSDYPTMYREVRVQLTNVDLEEPGELRLKNPVLELNNAVGSDTLDSWLVKNDDLFIDDVSPVTEWDKRKEIVMVDLLQGGYSVIPTDPNVAPDATIDPLDCEDLYVSKDGVDGTYFASNMLVSINGLIHRVIGNQQGAYVLGGWHNILTKGRFSLGAVCTEAVSSFQTFDFQGKVNILDIDLNRNVAVIDVGVDLTKYPLGLVLGGFLYLRSECYKLVSPTKLLIDFNGVPLAERHMEHYSAITPEVTTETRAALVEDLYDINGLIRLLEHPCTFLVAFDEPFGEMYCERYALENLRLNGKYQHTRPLIGIPWMENRLISLPYSWTNGEDQIASVYDFAIPQYEFYNMDSKDLRAMTQQCNRFRPGRQGEITTHIYYTL